jgi:coiled-coil domain-containing protein 12
MSLSAEAEKRKERLLALKKRKRGQTEDLEESTETPASPSNEESPTPQSDPAKPYLQFPNTSNPSSLPVSGRNYDATTRTTKLGYTESPLLKLPEDFETVEEVAINLAIDAIQEGDKLAKDTGEIDLFSLQPKRPNWDLKRDVEKKLERLKPKTDAAIARLVRDRLLLEKKSGVEHTDADLAKLVEKREQEEREQSV